MADLKISEMPDGGLVQVTDEIPVNRSNSNVKVKVGSGATANIGNDVGDLIVWDDDGGGNPLYPFGNGQNITNLSVSNIYDLGTAALVDTGTGAGNIPLNSDLGTAAYLEIESFYQKNEPVVTANITGTYDIDYNAGQVWDLTATGDCDIDIINPPSGGASIPVKIVQDSTPRVIDFVISGLSWSNGFVPSMPTTGGDYIWVLFVTDDGGTTWTGFDCGLVEP